MHDFGSLLTVVVLQVSAGVLVTHWLRHRTALSFSWAMGWLLVLCRIGLSMSAPWGGVAAQIVADCCLQVAALIFLDSLDRAYLSVKYGVPLAWVSAVPILLFTAGAHGLPAGVPKRTFFFIMLLASSMVSCVWAMRGKHVHKNISLPVVAVSTAMASRFILTGHAEQVPSLFIAVASVFTAIAFAKRYPKGSSGAGLVVAGFFGNGVAMLLTNVPHTGPTLLFMLDRCFDFLWILSVVGMLIVLIEEDVKAVRDLQQRERRIREELQHYGEVQIALQVEAMDNKVFMPACNAISERSPFREIAVLRRNTNGEAEVICHSLLHTTTKLGIATITQQYNNGDPKLRLSFHGSRSVMLRASDSSKSRNQKVPGRSLILPLPGQTGKPQGWLWLGNPSKPWNEITADDLLPLESFASRLAVSMENRELTRMLIRTDKLAGLGKLAGGVAHELNNPLTVVAGYAEIIHECTLEPSTRRQTAKILSEAMRMKRIIEDLNRFSQPPTAEYGIHNVVALMEEVGQSLHSDLMRRGVGFELHNSAPNAVVYGCKDSLTQVFFQLIINGAEALERAEREGGRPEEARIRVDVDQKDGRVTVLVSDNGPGFAEPERVFDPFYTTKGPGEGPGLGLSVSYGLVQEHQGEIFAYNVVPHGAAVCVTLPSAPKEVMQMPAPQQRIAGLPVASVPVAVGMSA